MACLAGPASVRKSKPGGERARRSSVAVQVGQFALAGLVALAVVGLATAIAARRVGEREAITEAPATTTARAEGLVAPVLTEGIVDGEPEAVAAVARVVELGVLDRSLVRVKLWTPLTADADRRHAPLTAALVRRDS